MWCTTNRLSLALWYYTLAGLPTRRWRNRRLSVTDSLLFFGTFAPCCWFGGGSDGQCSGSSGLKFPGRHRSGIISSCITISYPEPGCPQTMSKHWVLNKSGLSRSVHHNKQNARLRFSVGVRGAGSCTRITQERHNVFHVNVNYAMHGCVLHTQQRRCTRITHERHNVFHVNVNYAMHSCVLHRQRRRYTRITQERHSVFHVNANRVMHDCVIHTQRRRCTRIAQERHNVFHVNVSYAMYGCVLHTQRQRCTRITQERHNVFHVNVNYVMYCCVLHTQHRNTVGSSTSHVLTRSNHHSLDGWRMVLKLLRISHVLAGSNHHSLDGWRVVLKLLRIPHVLAWSNHHSLDGWRTVLNNALHIFRIKNAQRRVYFPPTSSILITYHTRYTFLE